MTLTRKQLWDLRVISCCTGTLPTIRSLSESSRETTLLVIGVISSMYHDDLYTLRRCYLHNFTMFPSQVDLVSYATDARSAGTYILIVLQSFESLFLSRYIMRG